MASIIQAGLFRTHKLDCTPDSVILETLADEVFDMSEQMAWSESQNAYCFRYPDGRVLHVDGDRFIEAVHDAKEADTEEAYDAAQVELLDPELWELNALEVPKGKRLEEMQNFFQYAAWITYES